MNRIYPMTYYSYPSNCLSGCLFIFLIVSLSGCGGDVQQKEELSLLAKDITTEECAVCSMVVREQAAPRGQLVHRNGARLFFCSISGMIQHMQAPSPHGKIIASWVEIFPANVDPMDLDVTAKPWKKFEHSFFVMGMKRQGIMGEPVMCFGTKKNATDFASKNNGRELSIEELKEELLY